MKSGILGFCGIKPVKITSFGPVISSKESERLEWIAKAEQLGKMLK
jgi:putative NADPH-quinone reductase